MRVIRLTIMCCVLGLWSTLTVTFGQDSGSGPDKTSGRSRNPLFSPAEPISAGTSPRRGQIGRHTESTATHSALHSSIPLGTADVFGNGPFDLFVAPNRLYAFQEFTPDGAPLYARARTFGGDDVQDVFTLPDGTIYGLTAAGRNVHVSRFDKHALAFEPFASSHELKLPEGLGGGAAGFVDGTGQLHVYCSLSEPGQGAYQPPGDHHSASFIPYDGAGFWRGHIPRRTLYHMHFDSLDLQRMVNLARVGDGPGQFLFGVRTVTIVDLGEDRPPTLVSGEQLGVMRCFDIAPSTGTPGLQRFVNDQQHVALRHPEINVSLKAIPDAETGLSNLIVAGSGRIWFYRFSGEFSRNGSPIYLPRQPVLAEDAPITLGNLPVISPGDVDGDGLTDLIAGNNCGDLLFVRNIGTPMRAEFANPVAVPVGGRPLDIKAGYRGSIQGPGEAMWGYTCPTLYDWDGDGRLDVILNSILADYMFLQQIPSEGLPAFSEPRSMYCDGLQLHLAWRSQPAITDWGGGERLSMIALDEQNLLRQFWRIDDQNLERGDLLRLADGSPITANVDEAAGQTGRAKLVAHDWDADGVIDLLIGTSRGLSIPASKTAWLPSHYGEDRQASVLLLRNVGTNKDPVFDYVKQIAFAGERIKLGVHSCSPAPVDLGRGVIDLLVGEEAGSVRHFPARVALGHWSRRVAVDPNSGPGCEPNLWWQSLIAVIP